MNFLAHAYLSFNQPGILTGNMISDFVKGKKKFDYSLSIQKGIELHRKIDRFTDEHEATREAKRVFSPAYRLYSGAFTDVVFDHFLAIDSNEFADEKALFNFSQQVYLLLEEDTVNFPEPFSRMFPYMRDQNWLYNYRTKQGIDKSLNGVVRRAAYLTESNTAFYLFEQYYQLLQACYRQLWAALKPFAVNQLAELNHAGPQEQ